MRTLIALVLLVMFSCQVAAQSPLPVEYPVAFLSAPRDVENNTHWTPMSVAEQNGLRKHQSGQDLVIAYPNGVEQVLVEGSQPEKGLVAVQDFCVSQDGTYIVYSHIWNTKLLDQRYQTYCDLYRVPVAGGDPVKLTDATKEWTPPYGAGAWFDAIEKPRNEINAVGNSSVWNTSPCILANGDIVM